MSTFQRCLMRRGLRDLWLLAESGRPPVISTIGKLSIGKLFIGNRYLCSRIACQHCLDVLQ